jgi:POT family proton-dependent oligopeptide transporter
MSSIIKSHPKGLYLLFATEMWERFSYYGMRALLVLYLTKQYVNGGLGFADADATLIYGFFTGFVYFTPLIGGWLADNYLGQRKSITIGGLTMMFGQFCLAFQQSVTFLYIGLFLLVIGNGFFKPNITVVVGDLYDADDSRRDSAFTIFYMGINLGAFFAPLVTGFFAFRYGYRFGFLAAGVGMFIGQLVYNILGKKYLGESGMYPAKGKNSTGKIEDKPLTTEEKDRTWVIIVLVVFCTFFWAGFEQAGSSMTLYTEKYINRDVFGFTVPTEWFQSVNPLFIVLLAPVFSVFWSLLSSKGKEPSIPVKMGLGMILLGLGFILMIGAAMQRGGDSLDESVKANIMFLVGAYLLHTMGELCLSPIGLSMVTKLSPVKLASLLMGVWFLSSFVANIAGGYIASYASKAGALNMFISITLVSIILGIVLLFINKWLSKKSHGLI